jgi:hypothetical protein
MKSSISEKMSILLERSFILMGIKTEGMDEEPKKQTQRSQGMQPGMQPGVQSGMQPGMQMPNMNMPQMNLPMNTSNQQETREMQSTQMNNMNFGIQEPMAANEMGGCYVNY